MLHPGHGPEPRPRRTQGLDIGPKSIDLLKDTLKGAKTVIWNGPMGVFEVRSAQLCPAERSPHKRTGAFRPPACCCPCLPAQAGCL